VEKTRMGFGASVRDLHAHEQVAASLLLPAPPFDFERSARIAAAGDPQVRRAQSGRYWQTIRLGRRLALAVLHAEGSVEEPRVYVELRSVGRLTTAELGDARDIVTRLFHLDLRPAAFLATATADPVMGTLVHRLHGLRPPGAATVFEEVALALLDHQLWTPAARGTPSVRLVQAYGDRLELVDGGHMAFPRPRALAVAREDDLRFCGLTRARARALRGVSRAVAEGLVDTESRADTGAALADLRALRGVGHWVEELDSLQGARRLDAVPIGDVALQRAVAHYYFGDRRVGEDQVRGVAARWAPWAGLAAHHLVVAWREGLEAAGRPRPG
jgi:3-methyladenine DNA glycosylase/8-oxoguanine DNA glycosylase